MSLQDELSSVRESIRSVKEDIRSIKEMFASKSDVQHESNRMEAKIMHVEHENLKNLNKALTRLTLLVFITGAMITKALLT